MARTSRRTRAAVSVLTLAGLGLAGSAVTTGPAQSAAPAGDCAVAFPVGELAAGDAVTGLTVSRGTTPEGFTGEVLGVLDDGIAPGVDMVMVRLSSAEIDRAGIWQGMSGSPVYAEDGRLIGAVGYGLAMGHSPVAGVTPYEQMDDYLETEAAEVVVDRTTARGTRRFEQLPMPLGVAGVGAHRLATAESRAGRHDWMSRAAYAVGRAGAARATAADLVPGGNLAASLSHGDITMAGVGTVTSVCGDRVVGFGHPLAWLGETTLALHPADAIYVQEDLVTSFKVANLGEPVGTVTDDRRAGITGTIGALPEGVEVSSTLTYGARSGTNESQVSVQDPDALASTTFYSILANHESVVDGPMRGTEEVAWHVTGTDAAGAPFELIYDNLYASQADLIWDVGFGAGDFVYFLSQTPGITIDSIEATGDLRDEVAPVRIARVEVRQGGDWVRVGRRNTPVVRGGGTLAVRVTLTTPDTATSEGTTTVLPARLDVPRSFAGRRPAVLQVAGGGRSYLGSLPSSVDKIEEWLEQRVRNDEVSVSLRRGRSDVQVVLGPVGGVVRGSTYAQVEVR